MMLLRDSRRRADMTAVLVGLMLLLVSWKVSPALAYQSIPLGHVLLDFSGTRAEYNADIVDAAALASVVELPGEDERLVVNIENLPVVVRDEETGDEHTGGVRFEVTGSKDGRATGQAVLQVNSRLFECYFYRVEFKSDEVGWFSGVELFGHCTDDGQSPLDVTAYFETGPLEANAQEVMVLITDGIPNE